MRPRTLWGVPATSWRQQVATTSQGFVSHMDGVGRPIRACDEEHQADLEEGFLAGPTAAYRDKNACARGTTESLGPRPAPGASRGTAAR